jgi:hypothetical protein
MDDVVITTYRSPSETLAWESWVRDDARRVPVLDRFRELAVFGTKRDDCRWQIADGMNLMKARGILQCPAIIRRKLRHIRVAQALNCDGEEHVKADLFHAQPNETELDLLVPLHFAWNELAIRVRNLSMSAAPCASSMAPTSATT